MEKEPPPVIKIDNSAASSSPTWRSLEVFVRDQVQPGLQRVLAEEVEELLGRAKHARRGTAVSGYRNGYGQPRQLALLNGTVTVRRPRVRNLDARFVSRVLPLFQRHTPEVVLAVESGHRESRESWAEILRDLTARGLPAPACVIDDGALRLWNAVGQVWPHAAEQRCCNHTFRNTYYQFPKAHWRHRRTTNVVESPFAAVRLRTSAAKRFKKVERATATIWRLLRVTEKRFRKLNAPEQCRDVYRGVRYADGIEVPAVSSTQKAAA
ncbi:MAG: hypothetical protein HEQ38_03040 [Gemmatimonas sp.]|nr:hypothetical protein [Gemmatimonas sp.]